MVFIELFYWKKTIIFEKAVEIYFRGEKYTVRYS